eukprot:g7743.t1
MLGYVLYYLAYPVVGLVYPPMSSWRPDTVWPLIVGAGMVWSVSFLAAGVLDRHLLDRGTTSGRRKLCYLLVLWIGAVLAWLFVIATSSPASAAKDGLIVDYGDAQFRMATPGANAAEKSKVATALEGSQQAAVTALGADFVLLGSMEGALPKAGPVTFYLVSKRAPVAAEPFPDGPGQVIAAIKGDRAVATYGLPKEVQYARLIGAVDVDGDGASELLLEANAMNMGEMQTSADLIKLLAKNGTRVEQTISGVYVDSCEAPRGEKLRTVKAISLEGGRLVTSDRSERCG